MSDEGYKSARHLPLEVLFAIIEITVLTFPANEVFSLWGVNKAFACQATKTLFRELDREPRKWKFVPHSLRVKYLHEKYDRNPDSSYLSTFVEEMLGLVPISDKETLRNKLIEGIALGRCQVRYLLGPKAAMRSTPWVRSWIRETLVDDCNVVLACRAIRRRDVSEFQEIFPKCNVVYGYRFQLSVLEEGARSGNREIVSLLLPYTMALELHFSQINRTKHQYVNAPRLQSKPGSAAIDTGYTRALAPIAVASGNREALEVWFEAMKQLPGHILEDTAKRIVKVLTEQQASRWTDLSKWFSKSLCCMVAKKNVQHLTFTTAVDGKDIQTIDTVLSEEDFDPCFVPPDKCGNLLLLVIRHCKKWYRYSLVKALLERGAHPNNGIAEEPTPLRQAISEEDYELASLLLDFGADVYQSSPNMPVAGRRCQLLVAAVLLGNSRLVKMLLEKGVSPYIKGNTNIHRVQLVSGSSVPLWDIVWQFCGSSAMRRKEYDAQVGAGGIPVNHWELGQMHASGYSGVKGPTSAKDVYEARVSYRLLEVDARAPQQEAGTCNNGS